MGLRTRLANIIDSLIIILTHPVRGESFSGLLTQHTAALDGAAMWKSSPAVTRLFDHAGRHAGRHDYSRDINGSGHCVIPVAIDTDDANGTRIIPDAIADGNATHRRERVDLLSIAIHVSTSSPRPHGRVKRASATWRFARELVDWDTGAGTHLGEGSGGDVTVAVCRLPLGREGITVPLHSRTETKKTPISRTRLLFRHAPWASSPGTSELDRTVLARGSGMS